MNPVRAVLFMLVFAAPAVTEASSIPPNSSGSLSLFFACANDQCVDVNGETSYEAVLSDGRISLSATYDTDPFISFTAATTNVTSGPVTYAFLFGTPIVPGLYNYAASTGALTLTNGSSGTATVDTSSIYSSYISGYGTLGLTPTNLGVDLGTSPCVAGPGTPFTVTTICSQGTATNMFAPTFYDNLELLLTYRQTDVGSVASWSGSVTLEQRAAVPEPALLGLLTTGWTGLYMRRRRKSR